MQDTTHPQPPDNSDGPLHEPEGVRMRGVIIGAAAILLLLVASHVLLAGLQWLFVATGPDPSPPASLATGQPKRSGPVLHSNQPDDLRRLREAEAHRLETYGWVDQKSKMARIPIHRAMEILAQKELKTHSKESAAAKSMRDGQPAEETIDPKY